MTKEFECPECGYKTEFAENFIDHLYSYHKGKGYAILTKLYLDKKIKVEVA